MNTKERIFELLDSAAMEQKVLAQMLGIPADTVSSWRRGKSASYTKYLPQIAEVLNTTTEYLLTGNGPKYKYDYDIVRLPAGASAQPDLMIKYNQLTPEGQKEVIAFVEFKLMHEKKQQEPDASSKHRAD